MEGYVTWFLLFLPVLLARTDDPSLSMTRNAGEQLECERMSQARAHELFPGRVPPPPVRKTQVVIDALVCRSRYVSKGERPARDEAILSTLGRSVRELADRATASASDDVTWHVDAFYPEPRVAGKIAVAARTELAGKGRRVSDRVPLLAAADLAILHPLPPEKAFPLACRRYFAERSLEDGDAFLAITLVDPRETQLHAGTCVQGEWRWLQ